MLYIQKVVVQLLSREQIEIFTCELINFLIKLARSNTPILFSYLDILIDLPFTFGASVASYRVRLD
jgi:hypothetical protein